MTEAEHIERLREALNEALLNMQSVEENATRVQRRLREQLEMIDYEAVGD